MNVRRVFLANTKTVRERQREMALRNELQRKRPSLEDLIRSGECDPDNIMTMGRYFEIQKARQDKKHDDQNEKAPG